MSLLKKRRMTEKNLAAHRRNAKLSRGPATAEGRERMRNANLRHGFYSKSDVAALRALGEDPAEFRKLREGLRGKRTAADILEEQIADRLARAFLRWNRADRMQDGYALRQAKAEDCSREGRLHVQMMRLKMISRNWQLLAQAVARPHYVTTPADLEMMKHLHKEGVVKEMSEVALALFYQLREPGLPGPGDPGFEDAEEEEKTRRVIRQVNEIFGIGMTAYPAPVADVTPASSRQGESRQDAGGTEVEVDDAETDQAAPHPDAAQIPDPESGVPNPEPKESNPYPNITENQWEARGPVRQLLENILSRQIQIFDTQHHDLLRQCVAGPSPHERAAEIAPTHPNAPFMQRMEDSNFRQILRMSHLLLRMRREERLGGALEDAPGSGKDTEKKVVSDAE